ASGLSLAIAAANSGSSAPLVIAVEGPQSGAKAANGVDQLRGVRLAVKQLNARGGLWDGRKVAVFAANDKADAAKAKAVARQVIAKGIRFVIGPYNSSVGIENLPLYRRAKVLPLWMTSRDETAGVGATVQPMNTQIAPIEQRYVKRLRARRVAMPKALAASSTAPRCLMGLANVDNGFVAKAPLAEAQRCVFSGVPAPTEMPSAKTYVRQYRATFRKTPGVWGSFTYDSARILFAAIDRAKSYGFAAVERQLRATKGYRGATGTIRINRKTGYRTNVPVRIVRV